MTIDRRQLLAGAALAGAASALPISVHAASAAASAGGLAQAPGFQRIAIGDTVVTALADGTLPIGAAAFPNASEEEFAAAMRDAFLPAGPYAAHVNAYLVQRNGLTVLVDAGGSAAMAPGLGHLHHQLAAAGVAPADVSAVLITHLHPDHIGGLVGPDGRAFPEATIVAHADEVAFWRNPATREAMPEPFRPMVDGANATLAAYADSDRLRTFSGADTGISGIDAVALPGHTPGHTGFRISDGDASLLLWGDLVHVAPVQMPRPEVFIGFDVAPEDAVATRLRLLDEVATDRTLVGGMHMPFPGFGHVARRGEGYAFVPTEWQYTL